MKLTIDVGGREAPAMLARMRRDSHVRVIPDNSTPHVYERPNFSIAVEDAELVHIGTGANVADAPGPDRDLLVTIGTPIPPARIDRITDLESAEREFTRQEGAFVSMYWNSAGRQLLVVTDFLGFKPLYIRRTPNGVQLASETKAWSAAADPAGWGAFLAFGHSIGRRTLLDGVSRMPAATIFRYELDSDTISQREYWHWPEPNDHRDTGALVQALNDSIEHYAAYERAGTLLLSGGFDSRLIACLLLRSGIDFDARSLSHSDELKDADSRFAEVLAHQLGIDFHRLHSAPDFFSSRAYLDYLFDSDAATPSLYLFISQVAQFVQDRPVWEGVIPGYTLPTPHQPPGGFSAYLAQECKSLAAPIWADASTIFDPAFVEAMHDGFRSDLDEELRRYPDNGHGVSEFIIRNRARNRTGINPLKVYEQRSRAYVPGMTRAYFDLAGSLSFEVRRDNRLYLELLDQHVPEARAVPILSGSTIIRPSGWSINYYAAQLTRFGLELSSRYPSIGRFLPDAWTPNPPQPSHFLQDRTLLDLQWLEDHERAAPYRRLHPQLLDRNRSDSLRTSARKLLFHWRAWHALHAASLYDAFETRS